ncbi:hypothetical protein Aco03nite_035680 [Actinoplanes couchii]|uniref:N-acetyltransferase domain-containing protein n=2 Tax=Actinoplanes couchii TaxID=403638 RepID=A0ABQ3X9I1_9ACTN|nr:hypothetical protein Aco03nite_035680 [Actinoplanes couchii]
MTGWVQGWHSARMELDIAPVGDRRELLAELDGGWPEFMRQDPTAALYYRWFDTLWPEFALLAVDRTTGRAVAKAHAVPLAYDGDPADGLPEGGWDWVIRTAVHDHLAGTEPTIVSALEINIRPDLRGTGLSARMLTAMRDNTAAHGFRDLVAPVRPSGKPSKINDPIAEYANATRPDGLPPRPLVTSPRPCGRPHPEHRPPQHDDDRNPGPVAQLDSPTVRQDRPGRGPGSPVPNTLRHSPELRRLRRTQHLGPPPHLTAPPDRPPAPTIHPAAPTDPAGLDHPAARSPGCPLAWLPARLAARSPGCPPAWLPARLASTGWHRSGSHLAG